MHTETSIERNMLEIIQFFGFQIIHAAFQSQTTIDTFNSTYKMLNSKVVAIQFACIHICAKKVFAIQTPCINYADRSINK